MKSQIAATLFMAMGAYTLFFASTSNNNESNENHSQQDVAWENFSSERLAQLREEGTPVFIDFTAKWCLICQANHLALSTDDVSNKFEEKGVVRMKADWTKNDKAITEQLKKYGRNSVPLYLLFPANKESSPEILPQLLTPGVIIEKLDAIASS